MLLISLNFTPRFALICTKVKLSKGRGNWNSIESVNKERETLEILYQIFFKGVRLEDYQIYSFEATRMIVKLIIQINSIEIDQYRIIVITSNTPFRCQRYT